MAGVLKQGGAAVAPRTLSLPVGEGWDVHAFSREGTNSVQGGLSRHRLPQGTLVALPTSHLLVLPLWLQTSDPALLHGLVANQLERLRPFAEENVEWAYRPVAAEADRTLVAVLLLPPVLPEALLVPQAAGYDFAVRALSLPERGSLLLREGDGLTLVAVREGLLAYAHHFPGAARVAEISSDLAGTARWLVMEQIVADPRPCVLRGDFAPDDHAALAALFGAAQVHAEETAPLHFPDPPLSLLPPSLRTARKTDADRRRRLRFFQALGLLYLIVVAAAVIDLVGLSRKVGHLEQAQSSVTKTVSGLRTAANRWHALQPAVDPDFYPLQALLATVGVMPPEIRLTQFAHTNGKILLAGEGKNAAVIFAFLKSVQRDPLLRQWTWSMPQPQILPSNRAQFQMEGLQVPTPEITFKEDR